MLNRLKLTHKESDDHVFVWVVRVVRGFTLISWSDVSVVDLDGVWWGQRWGTSESGRCLTLSI